MKRIFILFGALALALGSQAQMNQHSNYIGFNIGGGMNTLMFSPADGSWNPQLGFLGEFKYIHFFGKHFGMGLGVQFDYSRSGATYDWVDNANNALSLVHPANNLTYYPHVGFDSWKEIQTVMSVNVPIELYWRAPMGERWFFLLGLGAQLDFPLNNSTYKADDGSFTVTGYFPATNVEYRDLPAYGFDTYNADESGDNENLKQMGVSVIADLGFNYALSNHWGFYFGLYGGYGITNLLDGTSSTNLLVAPDATTATTTTGPLVSDYTGVYNSNQIDELHRLNVGLKIGINVGWNCHSTKGGDNEGALVPYDNSGNNNAGNGNNNAGNGNNNTYTNPDDEAAAAAQAAEEAAAREARCNARRMNNPDLAAAMANIDADLAEAEQAANESGSAAAKEAVADAKAAAADAKAAHKKGQYCKAYDLFNEAYGDIADSYAADARECAGKKNQPTASQAADDAALYAEAAHKDGLDCAMAASRNAKINSEIACGTDRGNAAYNDPNFANNLANEAIAMANETGSKPALTDGKDAAGKAYRGNLPESYAAAAKSFAESGEACAAKNNSAEAQAAVKEAKQYAAEAAEAARMGNTAAAYRAAVKARDAAQRACGTASKPVENKPADRAQLQKVLDEINATVNFDFAKTEPKFDEKTDRAINAICKAMAADRNLKVVVTGHTDSIGSDEGNMKYGMKRAEALKALMVKRGAPAANITTASKGEREPVVPNDTEEHRYMNRRAVITIK
ncbi:MAG: OmpA family protein [Bacteroidales bacterium]|nr:OmpA family protein [Bacteroidales bacterium]